MVRYEDRTPLWDYSDNGNLDRRSDYASRRDRARRAAEAGAYADEPHYGPAYPRRDGYPDSRRDDRGWADADERGRWGAYPEPAYPPLAGYDPYDFGYPRSVRGGRGSGRDDERGFFDRAGDEVMSWFGDRDAERRRERDHRGRGPRNYTRSDERIREDVNDRLTDDALLDASDVEVAIEDGEVVLAGEVDDRFAKRRAEDCAESVAGVRHVQNNLRYRPPGDAAAG